MRFLGKILASFVLVSVILGTWTWISSKADGSSRPFADLGDELRSLSPEKQQAILDLVSERTQRLSPGLAMARDERLRRDMSRPSKEIRERRAALQAEVDAYQPISKLAFLKAAALGDEATLLAAFEADLKQQVRKQEIAALDRILPRVEQGELQYRTLGITVEAARRDVRLARQELSRARCQLRGVASPCALESPVDAERLQNLSEDHPDVKRVQAATAGLQEATAQLRAAERQQLSARQALGAIEEVALPLPTVSDAVEELKREALSEARDWQSYVLRDGVPGAVKFCFGLVLALFCIRLVLFYVIAPRVERAAPRSVAPDFQSLSPPLERGPDRAPKGAAREIEVAVGRGEELLVRPGRAMLEPGDARVGKAWFLDRSRWFGCYLRGLSGFERIRSEDGSIAVGSGAMLVELCEISVPAGSGLVVIPAHLVGLVRPRHGPQPRLRFRLLLRSAFAWVTGHFRFTIIEGPARIILEGGGGLRIETADGRLGSYLDWVAFDASMPVSVRRPDSFLAYLFDWRGLARVRVASGSGYALRQLASVREARRKGAEHKIQGVIEAVTRPVGS